MGGLVSAILLRGQGLDVTVLERSSDPGGKMREVAIGGARLDAGPTVLTMRWVFDELLETVGETLDDLITVKKADLLARHAWDDQGHLDLFADVDRSADAIGAFAGAAEARGFTAFTKRAAKTYELLEDSFIRAAEPSPTGLAANAGFQGLTDLWLMSPFATMGDKLRSYFRDPRLQQLFGRYATYCGSSPFDAPATLTLIAHVEQAGVWLVEGGMHRLAVALNDLAIRLGVVVRYDSPVSEIRVTRSQVAGVKLAAGDVIDSDFVVANADVAALADGELGQAASAAGISMPLSRRSLSAITWNLVTETGGFPLTRHSVFFSDNYRAEFDEIFEQGRVPTAPTVYICAQDRDDFGHRPGNRETGDHETDHGPERLLCLINAPAIGDKHLFDETEIDQCESRTFDFLRRCGLEVNPQTTAKKITTPTDFHRLFPGTGGALYGMASHGWRASFQRPTARTSIPGLYLTGGSVHPGAGVPMAAMSGRLAANAVVADLSSTSR